MVRRPAWMRPAVSNVSNTCRDKERCEVMTGNPHAWGKIQAAALTWVGLDTGGGQKMRPCDAVRRNQRPSPRQQSQEVRLDYHFRVSINVLPIP